MVTNTDDMGTGSLRAAITQANLNPGSDIIDMTGVSGTITLTSGELDITDPVTINGPGAGTLVVSGNNTSRIFGIDDGAAGTSMSVTISGLTLTGGNAGTGDGGAIKVANEALTLSGMIISANAASRGAGVYIGPGGSLTVPQNAGISLIGNNATGTGANAGGGAIFLDASSTATIRDSAISDNQSTSNGEGGGGIGVAGNGTLTIQRTTISSNRALGLFANGGGVSFISNGTLTIDSSTLSGNSAVGSGGGISAGTAIATIDNSTISGNAANINGGGIAVTGSSLLARNTTIAFNTADSDNNSTGSGGGIFIEISNSATLQGTIVANNVAGPTPMAGPDINGGVLATMSLVKNTTGAVIINGSSGNLLGVDPLLGGLASNGGPTLTHALAASSPARDHGANFAGQAFDQRGAPFVRTIGAATDIGAFEFQSPGGGPPPGPFLQDPTPLAFQTAAQIVQTLQRGGTKLLAFAIGETNGDLRRDIVLAFRLRNGHLLIATLSGVDGGVLGVFQPFTRPLASTARVQLVLINLDANPPLDIGVIINGGGTGIPKVSAYTITGTKLL
jgi:hypothetical protein